MEEEGVTGRYDCDRFKEAVYKNIDYFRMEYKLTYAEVVGVLEIIQQVIIKESGATAD